MVRPIENSMMLSRPPEAVSDKARDIRQMGLNAGVMKYEEEKAAAQEINRPQAAENVEHARVNADEDKGGGGSGARGKKDGEEEEAARDLKQQASEFYLNLPVRSNLAAKDDKPLIDIRL